MLIVRTPIRIAVAICLLAVFATAAGCSQTNQPPADTAAAGSVSCAYPASDSAAKSVTAPKTSGVATTGSIKVTIHMDAGDVVMTLNRSGAPCAINSFESLATQKYFDDTSCHRLAPNFVLQCGDPTATGRGGPGYRFADELSGKETYRYGTVAMANAGTDTNGSQFFIVIAEDAQLPAKYVVLGSVDPASMAVIESIAAQGVSPTSSDPTNGPPAGNAHIKSVVIG